jgi:histidinol-phosphate aminotransferase
LRLYPDPTAEPLREKLAALHRCQPENIIVGNGSDELLAMAVRAFAEPASGSIAARMRSRASVQYFTPSYSLYPVLAEIHGSYRLPQVLDPDFAIPTLSHLKRGKRWDNNAALTFITTPNAPSGRAYPITQLEEVCTAQRGVVVLDEAYVDFARENSLSLALRRPNVLVARTFSKAYSLCFQRIGYCIGSAELIEGMQSIRDSYNVNGLGQIAALATLEDLSYYRRRWREIIATRTQLSNELEALGFLVFPSQTNFLLVRPPKLEAEIWLNELRARKILVRWFAALEVRRYLRITVGTADQAAALVKTAKAILADR